MGLENKVVLVTGAGQGIGQAIALAFSGKGGRIIVNDINQEGIKDTLEKIKSGGGEGLGLEADVSKANEVEKMIDQAVDKYGTLDILVNNAGIVKPAPMEELSEEDWDSVVGVNLKGTFLCSKYAARKMIKNRSGLMINIASIVGHEPSKDVGAYAATKAGVIMLTKQCAASWGQYNIRVNSISPGLIWTTITPAYNDSEIREARTAMIPLGRLGYAEDIASTALMLASDDASYVTGWDIVVDGGFSRNYLNLLPGRPGAVEEP
ncbi:SDR family NAD(P)-dependent oxidoreductase [Thermodesulfobacteriota bacterium]